MIDIVYNLLIIGLVVVWILKARFHGISALALWLKRHNFAVLVVLWILFSLCLAYNVLNFDKLTEETDVDDAVNAAVVNLLNGTNPYTEPVVPRFNEMGHFWLIGGGDHKPTWSYGPYNYLPLDLTVYAGMHKLLGSLGMPWWFVLANVVFSSIGLYLLRGVVKSGWRYYVPVAGMVILFLSLTNTSLTLLLICAALRVREEPLAQRENMSLVLFGLASLTKIFAIVPFAVLALYGVKSSISERDWHRFGRILASLGICAVIATVLLVPFGPANVINSTVFVWSAGSASDDAPPVGGSLLGALIPESEFYSLVCMACVLAALVLSFRFKLPVDRVLLVFVVLLLVIAKSSYSPLFLAGLFLTLRIRNVSLECPRRNVRSGEAGSDAGIRQPGAKPE
jgi:hypothetical protein